MVKLPEAFNDDVPEWQKEEVLSRLQALNENPAGGIDWETAINMIKQFM